MIKILKKENCMGCSACSQICPRNCITMNRDEEGFLYPNINIEVCVNCGMCNRVCPIENTEFVPKDGWPDAWLIYDNSIESRKKSAAGGGFAALARNFIESYQGVVFGAAYDECYHVFHCCVETVKDLEKLQKSKYVQSDIDNTYLIVKRYLEKRTYVLFSGTPCQIYGLKGFLGTMADSPFLFCIDLSCHGVPSPKVFEKYLNCLENKENSKISSFTMRDKKIKKNAYEQGFGIHFQNGCSQFNSHNQDLFGRCFWGEIVSRPSCYHCHFKTVWRAADITLGDCWFFNCYVPNEMDQYGVTLALIHSEKGYCLLKQAKELVKYSVPAEELIKANGGMLYSSAVAHPKRADFFAKLDKVPFDELVNMYFPLKIRSKKQFVIDILGVLGIRLEILRKFSRRKKLSQRLRRVIPDAAKGEMR